MSWIKVFAPATIGNIGPGFDVLGLAVKGMGDTVMARKIESGLKISAVNGKHELSADPEKNTVTLAAKEVLKTIDVEGGIEFKLYKGMPVGSGLGSSAASAAAGAFAANELFGRPLSKNELIFPATKAEEIVSGGFFADNTAPATLGGATLTRTMEPLDVTRIGSIHSLKIVLVTPDVVILTKDAREMLPQKVVMDDFVANMANTALITAAFSKDDYSLFARSLNDCVIEPVRCKLIKGFKEVKQAALEAGADGMTISGSGPTVFAITNDEGKADWIRNRMVNTFRDIGIASDSLITEVDDEGTRLVERDE